MCVASVVAGVVIGGAANQSRSPDGIAEIVTGPPRVTIENPLHEPYIRFIRRYLEQNLPDGQWEEIRWYGTRTADPPGYGTDARLKFRARNENGAVEVYDWSWRFGEQGFRLVMDGYMWTGSEDRDPIPIDENALP